MNDVDNQLNPPEEFFQSNIGKDVIVKLQTNEVYKGRLISLDGAMNVYLQNSEEILDEPKEKIRHFKHLFIRGNNGKIIF